MDQSKVQLDAKAKEIVGWLVSTGVSDRELFLYSESLVTAPESETSNPLWFCTIKKLSQHPRARKVMKWTTERAERVILAHKLKAKDPNKYTWKNLLKKFDT